MTPYHMVWQLEGASLSENIRIQSVEQAPVSAYIDIMELWRLMLVESLAHWSLQGTYLILG